MKTAEFFERLPREGKARLTGPVRGTVRVELTSATGTEYWLLTIGPDGIPAAPENRAADCVIRMDRELFEKIASGEVNFLAAVLRGEVAVEGEPDLLVAVQRLFPGPPGARIPPQAGPAGRDVPAGRDMPAGRDVLS